MRVRVFCLIFLLGLFGCRKQNEPTQTVPDSQVSWVYADSIQQSIRLPEIPTDTFLLNFFGRAGQPDQIQKAIDFVADLGGGTILIPKGTYQTGTIVLRSKINLFLEEGAVLNFLPQPEIYPLAYNWFKGIPCMNYSPLIYAKNETDILINGKGTIDGQGSAIDWKSMKYHEKTDWELLKDLEDENVKPSNRKFGKGHSLRPDLIAFVECSRVALSGVTIQNAPFWLLHPVLCRDVTIRNCRVKSEGYDQVGIGLESSENVLIDSCAFGGVDDGVKILSGRVKIPGNHASRNVIIQNSTFENTVYSAVIISSQTAAGANRIFMSGLNVDSTQMAFRMFANAGLKGEIHDVFIKDCRADYVAGSFIYGKIYNSSKLKRANPLLYNIHLDGITTKNCGRAFLFTGHCKNVIQNVWVKGSKFSTVKGSFVRYLQNFHFNNVSENGEHYTGTHITGNVEIPKIKLERDEDDILDSDDIKLSELPESVKKMLDQNYPGVPVDDIDRMITRSNVIYEIDLLVNSSKEKQLLIQSDGKLVRSESDVAFSELPPAVVFALESYLKTPAVPYMLNEIKKIDVQDFSYYELKGEYNKQLFAMGITGNGNIIEKKQKQITTYFLPNK